MADVPVPRKLIFVPDEIYAKNLKQCKEERNTQNWFSYCKSNCEMFRITTFEEFFEPYTDKYEAFYEFIRDQMEFISNEEAKDTEHNNRLLSEPQKKKKIAKSVLKKKTKFL